MAVLEALVIVTIVLAGVWVGYNAWEKSLKYDPYENVDLHSIVSPSPITLYDTSYTKPSHTFLYYTV